MNSSDKTVIRNLIHSEKSGVSTGKRQVREDKLSSGGQSHKEKSQFCGRCE